MDYQDQNKKKKILKEKKKDTERNMKGEDIYRLDFKNLGSLLGAKVDSEAIREEEKICIKFYKDIGVPIYHWSQPRCTHEIITLSFITLQPELSSSNIFKFQRDSMIEIDRHGRVVKVIRAGENEQEAYYKLLNFVISRPNNNLRRYKIVGREDTNTTQIKEEENKTEAVLSRLRDRINRNINSLETSEKKIDLNVAFGLRMVRILISDELQKIRDTNHHLRLK